MPQPDVTVIVPTHDRPQLVAAAVASALAQDLPAGALEVVVVDDGSPEAVTLPGDPRLRVLRHERPRGGAAARNTGTDEARGRYVTYLDDDDELTPDHAATALEALDDDNGGPRPTGVLLGLAVVDHDGGLLETRLPPTLARGQHFALEPTQPGRSFHVKQSLVVAPETIRAAGGWDPAFRSRVHTELFLRLNPVCALRGVDAVTYRLRSHPGPRVSGDPTLRRDSFRQLLARHGPVLADHPERFAEMLVQHARLSRQAGLHGEALWAWQRAVRTDPRTALREAAVSGVAETRHRRPGRRRPPAGPGPARPA